MASRQIRPNGNPGERVTRRPVSAQQKATMQQRRAEQTAQAKKARTRKVAFGIVLVLVLSIGAYLAFGNKDGGLFHKGSQPVSANSATYTDSDFVVVVDAGHGGFDVGTKGAITGIQEKGINLSIAEYLKEDLEAMGCKVIMTRTKDEAIAETKEADMKKREEIMAASYVDIIISVHQNFFEGSSDTFGPQVFHKTGSATHEEYAKILQDALNEELDIAEPRRRHTAHDYQLLKYAPYPAVIVECGFLSNKQEEKLLSTRQYQKQVAAAIAKGVQAYITQKGISV